MELFADGGAKGADLVVAPDGVLYASWVANGHVWVVSSEDGGDSWSESVYVNQAMGPPDVYQDSHPNLAVDEDRLLVAMSGAGKQQLYESARGTLDFGEPVVLEDFNHGMQFEGIFLMVTLDRQGEAWLSTHAFPPDSWEDGWKALARESEGYVLDPASDGADGLPCECCPQDLFFPSAGTSILAYRNNVDNLRDMSVAVGADGGFPDSWSDVSTNEWVVPYCPVQGPRMAEDPDGTVHLVWTDGVGGSNEVYTVRSADGGLSWGATQQILADEEDQGRGSPMVAVDDGGRVLVSWNEAKAGAVLAWSEDGGESWSRHGAVTPGEAPLRYLELAAGGGFLGGVAADDDGHVWLVRVR